MDFIDFAKAWFDKNRNRYSADELCIFIYDLWQDGIIEDDEEDELYAYADPDNLCTEPCELWYDWEKENPLLASWEEVDGKIL